MTFHRCKELTMISYCSVNAFPWRFKRCGHVFVVETVTWWHTTARSHTSANSAAVTRVTVTLGRCVDTWKTTISSCYQTRPHFRTVTVELLRPLVLRRMPPAQSSTLSCHFCSSSILAVQDPLVAWRIWHRMAAPAKSGLLVFTHSSKQLINCCPIWLRYTVSEINTLCSCNFRLYNNWCLLYFWVTHANEFCDFCFHLSHVQYLQRNIIRIFLWNTQNAPSLSHSQSRGQVTTPILTPQFIPESPRVSGDWSGAKFSKFFRKIFGRLMSKEGMLFSKLL